MSSSKERSARAIEEEEHRRGEIARIDKNLVALLQTTTLRSKGEGVEKLPQAYESSLRFIYAIVNAVASGLGAYLRNFVPLRAVWKSLFSPYQNGEELVVGGGAAWRVGSGGVSGSRVRLFPEFLTEWAERAAMLNIVGDQASTNIVSSNALSGVILSIFAPMYVTGSTTISN